MKFLFLCLFLLFLFIFVLIQGLLLLRREWKKYIPRIMCDYWFKSSKSPPPISLFLLYLFFTFISVIVIFFLMKFKLFGYQLFINVQVEMVVDFPCIAYCLTHSIVYRKWALEVGRSESCNIWEENLFFGKA